MELQFQPQQEQHRQFPVSKPPLKSKNKLKSGSSSNKFVGVRQRPSGRWVAEIKDTTKKIRMWLGTFETPEEAARAYDAAACLLRGSNTRTNFAAHAASPAADSPLASRIRNLLNLKKQKKNKTPRFTPPPNTSSPCTNPPPHPSPSASLTRASSSSAATSSSSNSTEPAASRIESKQQGACTGQMDEEVYRPCFGNGGEELEFWNSLASSSDNSWLLDYVELPKVESEAEITEFERMKVERQFSASLYAINGVQEYFDMVHDPSDTLWDLPPLCHLSCRT
ncbi:hypothetical protein Cni_G28154 [Canna indica]|uniref:AP2/ERF domain-containing protein n=1 Tax=Canna indica TaxID=4628 RepID=A0AAQ3QNK4_9LILI|nr:hypothetical protein Cni_G28154 [Canna indica]